MNASPDEIVFHFKDANNDQNVILHSGLINFIDCISEKIKKEANRKNFLENIISMIALEITSACERFL